MINKVTKNNSKNKNNKSFQYGAFFAEKVLGVPSFLLSKESRNIIFSLQGLSRLLIPRNLTNLSSTIEDLKDSYGSEKNVKRRSVEDARWKVRPKSKKKSKASMKEDTLEDFEELFETFDEKNISDFTSNDIQNLRKKVDQIKKDIYVSKVSSPDDSPFAARATSRATPNPLKGSIVDALKGSIDSEATNINSQSILSLIDIQNNVLNLLRLNFKSIDEHLKDINKSIKNINIPKGSGGGMFDFFPDRKGKGDLKKSKFKEAAGAAVSLLPKMAKVAGAGFVAYDVTKSLASIQRAEEMGIFNKEQAKEARRNILLKAGVSTSLGVAGATIGASGGPLTALAGGAAGFYAGGKLTQSYLDSKNFDRSASYLAAVANMESSLRAQPPSTGTSNAAGLYQFIPQTWEALNKKYNKGYDLSSSKDPRLDPSKSLEMMKLLTRENQSILEKRLGRTITGPELYMAHFLGPEDALKLISAAPQSNPSLLFPKAVGANPNIFYKKDNQLRTSEEVRNLLKSKYERSAQTLGLPQNQITKPLPYIPPNFINQPAAIVSEETSIPTIQASTLNAAVKAEAQSKMNDKGLQEKMSSSFDKLLKTPALNQSKLNASATNPVIISGGSGNNQQSPMDDINVLHLMYGLHLNILV